MMIVLVLQEMHMSFGQQLSVHKTTTASSHYGQQTHVDFLRFSSKVISVHLQLVPFTLRLNIKPVK
jgi:hypothetical protein